MTNLAYRYWNSYTREYFYKPRERVTTFGLMVPVFLVLFYLFGIRPLWKSMTERQALIEERRQVMKSIDKNYKVMTLQQTALSESTASAEAIDRLNKYVPEEQQLSELVSYLSQTATANGFEMAFLQPVKSVESMPKLHGLTLNIVLTGNLQNTLDLVKAYENSDRFIGIRKIFIQSSGGKTGEVRMEAKVYFFEADK